MESKDIKDITEPLADSLDNTQKNSTDTEMMVRQVLSLSDENGHTRIIDGILADNTMSWENKVALIKEVYADYDIREENNTRRVMNMQSTQTQNVGAATGWWSRNWGWVAAGGVTLIGVFTPGGRKMIASATKFLLTA